MAINDNSAVYRYVNSIKAWSEELIMLRQIVRDTTDELHEDMKWRQPVYTFQKANVLILGSMKASCVIGFFKGALLDDPEGHLVVPGPNSQAVRRLHFTSVDDVQQKSNVIQHMIRQAIELERSGVQIQRKPISEYPIPSEFKEVLEKWGDVRAAFESMTPSCRREYLMYFSSAKKSATRRSRVERSLDAILEGKTRRTR